MVAGDEPHPDVPVLQFLQHQLGGFAWRVGQADQAHRRQGVAANPFELHGIRGGRGRVIRTQVAFGDGQNPQPTGGHLVDLLRQVLPVPGHGCGEDLRRTFDRHRGPP
jgi:hypothetical protein